MYTYSCSYCASPDSLFSILALVVLSCKVVSFFYPVCPNLQNEYHGIVCVASELEFLFKHTQSLIV